MEQLVGFLARGLVSRPDDVRVHAIAGETVMIVELYVHPDDVARIEGPEGRTLRAIRQVLAASSGQRKAMLELVDPRARSAEAASAEE